jgi:hypothetical protein
MDFGGIVKWVVILVLIYLVWTVGLPWIQKQKGPAPASSQSNSDGSCVNFAERASETWGGGIGRFVNPPYDTMAWDSFRGNVESRIRSAESACDCSTSSCDRARDAMRDLRAVVNDVDEAMRSNSSMPSDIVQRQESIDNRINEARDLVRGGN